MSTVADLPASAELLIGSNGSFRFGQGPDGLGMQLSYKVKWEDSPAFLAVVAGSPVMVGAFTRRIPLQNPFISTLYAVAISDGRGMGSDSLVTSTRPYPWLVYTIEFAPLPYGVDGDSAFITIEHSGAGRTVTVPGRQYAFADGTKIQQDIGIPVGGVGINCTIHQLPSLTAFLSVVFPILNTVNSSALTVGGVTYAAGCVYFDTFSSSTSQSLLGQVENSATVSLIYSDLPWNQAIKPNGTPDNVSPAPFGVSDLNALVM